MIDALNSLGESFTPDAYLFLTRIQGSLWTLADFVIILYLIRIANVLRRYLRRRAHIVSYVVLACTAPFALLLPIAPTGLAFFRLELVVTVPHFLLILYLLASNMQIVVEAVNRRLSAMEGSGSSKPKSLNLT